MTKKNRLGAVFVFRDVAQAVGKRQQSCAVPRGFPRYPPVLRAACFIHCNSVSLTRWSTFVQLFVNFYLLRSFEFSP